MKNQVFYKTVLLKRINYFLLNSVLLLLTCLSQSIIAAPEPLNKDSYGRIEVDVIGLYNPLGISFSAAGFYRKIYRSDQSKLWDGLYYQAGVQTNINPAFNRVGVHVEWMPVAILQLRLQYDRLFFSGSFGSLLSFANSEELFGDDEIEAREGDEKSGEGERSAVHITLRGRIDNIIIRNVVKYSSYHFPGAGPYYLEREHELLMAKDDRVFFNQLYLLFEDTVVNKRKRFFGPYHEYVTIEKSNLTTERLGVTWFQEYEKSIGLFQKPRWYLQAGSYLQDPNRKDELYFIIGFGGDINL